MRIEGKMVVTTMRAYMPEDPEALWNAAATKKVVDTVLMLEDGMPFKALVQDGYTMKVSYYKNVSRGDMTCKERTFLTNPEQGIVVASYDFACPNKVCWEANLPSRFNPKVPDSEIWPCIANHYTTWVCGATPLVTLGADGRRIVAYWDRAFDEELRRLGAFDLLDSVIHL